MGSFTKTINPTNFNLGNGLISSTNIFQPSNYNTNFNGTGYDSGYGLVINNTGNNPKPNSIISQGQSTSYGDYYLPSPFVNNIAPVYGPLQFPDHVFDLKAIPGNLYLVAGIYVISQTGSISLTNVNSYFVEKTISIPSSPQSKLKMFLNFSTSSTQSLEYVPSQKYYRISSSYPPIWYSVSNMINDLVYKPTSKVCFRILANNVVVFDLKNNFVGNIDVTIPPGTTSIKFETYDDAFPNGTPTNYFKNADYYVIYNNLRINVEGQPSRPIGNDTRLGIGYSYIEPIRASSLSVSDIDTNGYHEIILGQSEKDRPVSYYVVGDDWKDPNFRPLNANRNVCLEFPNIDFSDIDEDERIELVLDVIDINTEEAEEQYDHLGIPKPTTREFYKFGDNAIDSPPNTRRARMNCSVARADFVDTIAAISTGPSNHTIATKVPVKGGILIYDITDAVKESIIAGRQKIVVWLTYDEGTRDKYVTFRIGNTEQNKPRIRFKPKP